MISKNYVDGLEIRVEELNQKTLAQQQEIERLRNPWISVEDELPSDTKGKVYCCNADGDSWTSTKEPHESWDSAEWLITDGVTHWMPLPQPPKGESDEC